MGRRISAGFTLGQLMAALAVILAAALLLPAVAATLVNRARVTAATHAAGSLARTLGRALPAERPAAPDIDLLAGDGQPPRVSRGDLWGSTRIGSLADRAGLEPGQAVVPDPWGNRFVVNIGAWRPPPLPARPAQALPRAVWVLSAGPNGVIETPFDQPGESARLGGDDVGVRVR